LPIPYRLYPAVTRAGLTCNDDVVKLLSDFIDHLGEGLVMPVGHSYGAYLARGLAAKRPDMVLGLVVRMHEHFSKTAGR
jgi:pimeloyl-ACP methyl ester carboxylesterase